MAAMSEEYRVTVRYYEELNDFLPREKRKKDIELTYAGRRSVKDLIESMKVPHVEVDLILANGSSVDFSYPVKDGDRISVYPVFERLDISGAARLRPEPLRETRFVCDIHLKKLVKRLRLLGFDTAFGEVRDEVLAEISDTEKRVLLSRDRQLLMRKKVTRGLYVRNTDPERQIIEMLDRLDLWESCRPFTRCIECNGQIETVELDSPDFEEIRDDVPPGVIEWCREYFRCSRCGRIYWKGSHYDRLINRVEGILNQKRGDGAGSRSVVKDKYSE